MLYVYASFMVLVVRQWPDNPDAGILKYHDCTHSLDTCA